MFHCLAQETWLDGSWKLIYINQSKFYNLVHVGKFENVNITSKCFNVFKNKSPGTWVGQITRDFLRCYFSSYYSSIVYLNEFNLGKFVPWP